MIVFLCCTGLSSPLEGIAAIFELQGQEYRLVGVPSSGRKIAYRTTPGRHFFMIAARHVNADFMKAEVSPGKTYFAAVTVRGGGGISLRPINRDIVRSERINRLREKTRFFEVSSKGEDFLKNNPEYRKKIDDIRYVKQAQWDRRPYHHSIRPEDGL